MQQITDILKQCTIEGNNIKLPSIQLDRNTYIDVKKSLELIGGKWKGGKTQAFVFREDPTEYLEQLCQGEKINLKKEFQFFGTPAPIADRLVELADVQTGHKILEPSAGQGAIIESIWRKHSLLGEKIDYCELMPLNQTFLGKIPNTVFLKDNFLELDRSFYNYYDRIIANPPFSKNQDIEHVYKMYHCLNSTGRLVSVMSKHWQFAQGKKEKDFYNFLSALHATVHEIEEGAFKESGTNISACIVVIDKDPSVEPPIFERSNKTKTEFQNSHTTKNDPVDNSFDYEPDDLPEPEEILKDLIKTEAEIQSGLKGLVSMLNESQKPTSPTESFKMFTESFNEFGYRFNQSEVFIDFIDYALLASKWWENGRDFSYFKNKYTNLFPKFNTMFELLGDVSEGFKDGLGDLFMDIVSHGRNGQFFTPDHVCDMMSMITIPEVHNGITVLDPACGSGRMLLAAAKRNRNIYLFGNDIDVTCCKMAVLNLIINTLQGEIALMNALTMDYQKSWEVSYRNVNGANLPVFRVIENKDDSVLWKLHMNSFKQEKPKPDIKEVVKPIILETHKETATQLQLF